MPPVLVRGVKDALADVRGPIILIANLLTEGRGMSGFTAAESARWIGEAIGRPVDVIIANSDGTAPDVLARYAVEHKAPLAIGEVDAGCQVVVGRFWRKDIARHDRRRLSFAVWSAW
jgi:2-phospho-L-lactate transferase/gluconeogenesis factor (CofD/UPF0052 family)